MTTRHVILGAGPAGINAIETLRSVDPECDIALVCDEPAYSRMVLPYYLAGKVEEASVHTADAAWFDAQRVTAHMGRRATGLSSDAKTLELDDGTSLAYDALLVATGSRAWQPDIAGLDSPGVGNMWTLADARTYLAEPRGEVVVVGAGFIGLIVLDALIAAGASVSYLEIAPQILPRMLDATAAALVEAHLRDCGVAIRTGESLERIEREGGRLVLRLGGGGSLACDAVVTATGIRPNVEFLAGSGVETDHGIAVDDHLCSSVASVYAAGDVAQGPDLLGGPATVHAIQPTAIDHGRVAAANMAGLDVRYEGSLTMNVLHTQSLESCSFGRWSGDGAETTTVENAANRIYRKYVWDGDRMVGGVFVGPTLAVSNVNDVGMLKGLIQSGVALGAWKDYLIENPLDLRRVYVASGAAKALLSSTLLTGRVSTGGGYRFPAVAPKRPRSKHHATLVGTS